MNPATYYQPDMRMIASPNKPITRGHCRACNHFVDPEDATSHIMCLCEGNVTDFLQEKNNYQPLDTGYLIKVGSSNARWTYWMYFTVPMEFRFSRIDKFLKDYWCECCGHSSSFTIGNNERSLKKTQEIRDRVVPGMTFQYEFDSALELSLEVIAMIPCPTRHITIVMQNEKPFIPCALCVTHAADHMCSGCWRRYCNDCLHHRSVCRCARDQLLPLLNSPRAGQCNYHGPKPNKRMPY